MGRTPTLQTEQHVTAPAPHLTLSAPLQFNPGDGVLVETTIEANTGEVLKAEQLTDDGRVPGDGGPVDTP